MKCERCGAMLQDDVVYCKYCGQVLQRVPDYNPLEDVIADEVRSSIRQETSEITIPQGYTGRNVRVPNPRPAREGRYTGRLNPREQAAKEEAAREEAVREEAEAKAAKELEIRKRRETEKRRALKKKKRRILIIAMCSIVALIVLIILGVHNASYSGQLTKGEKALSKGEYTDAVDYLNNALDKDNSKSEVYLLLAEAYTELGQYSSVAYNLLQAVEIIPDNIELHQALIDCYLAQDDTVAVKEYIETIKDDQILDALSAYIVTEPVFSLDEGTYEDVQELIITCDSGTIYYTTNGTTATQNSNIYEGGIQLSEGTTVVRAIVVNDEGITSDEVKLEYVIELPMESAPVVTPSTGQYTEETYITVTVPSGYTAYYTLDNTTPDTSSLVYTEPIEMPEGNTIFTVVLVNASGKYSDMTKRNYDLTIKSNDTTDTSVTTE